MKQILTVKTLPLIFDNFTISATLGKINYERNLSLNSKYEMTVNPEFRKYKRLLDWDTSTLTDMDVNTLAETDYELV